MASSPDSDHGSQSGSRTPTNKTADSQARVAGSELSPPGSQTRQASDAAGVSGNAKTGSTNEADMPGASWMNKRAEEEYHRALECVVDKDFNLRTLSVFFRLGPLGTKRRIWRCLGEFGDPFDETDMQEPFL